MNIEPPPESGDRAASVLGFAGADAEIAAPRLLKTADEMDYSLRLELEAVAALRKDPGGIRPGFAFVRPVSRRAQHFGADEAMRRHRCLAPSDLNSP